MMITCGKSSNSNSSNKNNLNIQSNAAVKKLAKFAYKNLAGAYKFDSKANECDVYFTVLYQVPLEDRVVKHFKDGSYDVQEMKIDLNITTYQNKVRVNLIELSPDERTLGYDRYEPELIQSDIQAAMKKVWDKIQKRLTKAYENYDFLF